MKPFFSKLVRWWRAAFGPSGVSESDIASNFASMGDIRLGRIDPRELTPEAHRLWQAEKERRSNPQARPPNHSSD